MTRPDEPQDPTHRYDRLDGPDPMVPVPLHDPLAERLRAALHREADMVHPSDDGLARITTRLEEEDMHHDESGRPGWLAWVVGAAAAVVIGLVAGVLVLGDDDAPDPVATGGPSPSVTETTSAPETTSPSTSPTTSAPAAELDGVPVYWVGDSKVNSWLYREFRTVPDAGGEVKSAVSQAMSGDPLDPDYRTPWSAPSRLDVTQEGDAITVDVSEDAFANTQVGSREAELAVQQIVYTATAAAQSSGPVTILVDGEPYDAWGTMGLGEPMTRSPQLDVQAPIWIDSPTEGATVQAGEVTVTGQAISFEATILWEVVDGEGVVVAEDFAMGGGSEILPYEFSADLEPGEYTVHVWSPDESGGESPEGPRMFEQTRTFTVG